MRPTLSPRQAARCGHPAAFAGKVWALQAMTVARSLLQQPGFECELLIFVNNASIR
jgi:hypothetical protein